MKIIVFICFFVIISCTPKENNEQKEIVEESYTGLITEIQQEYLNKIMYTNAQAGLRVRNLPGLDGIITGSLDFGTEVIITYKDNNIVVIDDIEGRWVHIKSPIEGWIFNGYLIDNKYNLLDNDPSLLAELIIGTWDWIDENNPRMVSGGFMYFGTDKIYREGMRNAGGGGTGTWYLDENIVSTVFPQVDESGIPLGTYVTIKFSIEVIDYDNIITTSMLYGHQNRWRRSRLEWNR